MVVSKCPLKRTLSLCDSKNGKFLIYLQQSQEQTACQLKIKCHSQETNCSKMYYLHRKSWGSANSFLPGPQKCWKTLKQKLPIANTVLLFSGECRKRNLLQINNDGQKFLVCRYVEVILEMNKKNIYFFLKANFYLCFALKIKLLKKFKQINLKSLLYI